MLLVKNIGNSTIKADTSEHSNCWQPVPGHTHLIYTPNIDQNLEVKTATLQKKANSFLLEKLSNCIYLKQTTGTDISEDE